MSVPHSSRHGKKTQPFQRHSKERIQPFQRHQASDERFQALVAESADVFWMLTPKGEMQETCSSWQTFTGQAQSHCLGQGWLDALYPTDRTQIEKKLLQVVISGDKAEVECHIRKYDTTYHLVRIRMIPVSRYKEPMYEILMCGNDITKKELNEQMSEAHMQFALNASGVGLWDWDLLSDQVVWTEQNKALFGLSPSTPISYERLLEMIHPDDSELIKQFRARTLRGKQEKSQDESTNVATNKRKYNNCFRTIWPDGSIHWLEDRVQLMYNAQGEATHVLGLTIDVTDLKQAEEVLRRGQEEMRLLAETIPQLVWISRPDGFHEFFNQQFYNYTHTTFEQINGERWSNILHPDDRQKILETWHTSLQTGQAYEIENRIRESETGEYQWFLTRATPLRDDQGHILKWFGTCTNIDAQKRAEEALRESEVRFHRLMEANIIGILVSDLQGTVREANDAFLSLVGYTKEDLAAGKVRWPDMTPPEYLEQSMQAMQELLAKGAMPPFEKEYQTKDGRRVPILLGSTLFYRRNAEPLLLTFVLDLTARKELEHQKDLMLGMTSHELKTPLAALKGTFQLMQRRVKRLQSQHNDLPVEIRTFFTDLLERMAACVRQVDVQTHLINDLLDVSRITAKTLQLDLEHCDLVSIVQETVEDLRMIAPERTLLLELPGHTTINVFVDRGRIGQVVTNYVTNALRYSSSDQPIQIGLNIQEQMARVWVRDKGPGLTEEAQAELWQRFYQVKGMSVQSGSGKGLGLGLYICQTLIAQHQGHVGVESAPGEGSTFWFTLPIVP
jgi:PAS domain S-box-containing protein